MALREQTQRLLSQEDVTADNVEEMYGVEGVDLPDITAKDVGMFVAESTPFLGEAIGIKRTSDALDEGDYVGAGIEGAATLVGVLPVFGDAAGKALRATTRKLRKDAKLKVDNPGFDEVYQETYAETKQRASDKVKNEAIEAGQTDTYETNIGTSGGVTGYANSVTFTPNELKDLPGAMGEEKFRSSGKKLDRLKKSIAEKGYDPKDNNILIHVREDGQPFIVEGNHRLAEAVESGRETITADIRYLRGAEEKAGPLDPRNIFPNQMVDDAPAPRMGYDPNNESSRVFHLTKADFDTADVIGSGTSDIGFHVGTAQQATARGSTQTNYDPKLAEQMVKGERILPMVLKADLKPARIVDMSNFKVPGSWLANLSVASSDLQRIKFLKGDESDAALFAKAPKVKVDNETYTMLPDAMRAGMDEDLWRDIIIEAHRAKRRGLDTINSQEDRIAWFNTLKETANKNGYDSFVYRNEYEGAATENIDELVEQIQRAQRGEIDPADIDMNSRFADSYMLLEPNQVKGLFGGMTESSPEFMKNKGGLMLQKGGAVPMKEQMELFADGGLEQDGGTKDPVSGNDVPPGAAQEEVRDDIPAQLSEGEFVFPADVVRYIGLEKLMRMRQEAKMGLKMMEEMGQMGNADEATMPDDLPFGITDLIIVDGSEGVDDDDKKEYNIGGVVNQPSNIQSGQTQIGMAPTPMSMPEITRPQQQDVPTYKPPETVPTFTEYMQPSTEQMAPQTITIVNVETGEERMITFIPGVTQIPAGFVRKEDYVPKEIVPETDATLENTSVREDDNEPPQTAEEVAEMTARVNAAKKMGITERVGFSMKGALGRYGPEDVGKYTSTGYIIGKGGVLLDPLTGMTREQSSPNMIAAILDAIAGDKEPPKPAYSDEFFDAMPDQAKDVLGRSLGKEARDARMEAAKTQRKEYEDILNLLEKKTGTTSRRALTARILEQREDAKEAVQQNKNKIAEVQAQARNQIFKDNDTITITERDSDNNVTSSREVNARDFQKDVDDYTANRVSEAIVTGDYSRGFAEGGLASKPKPKAKKKMKRGGLASKK